MIKLLRSLLIVGIVLCAGQGYASGIPTVDIVGNIRGALQLVQDNLNTIENQVQTVQQVQQIANEVQMIEHQIRNLANLDDFNFADVAGELDRLKELANQAGGLAAGTIELRQRYEEYKDDDYYQENSEAINKELFDSARKRWNDDQMATAKASAAVLEEQSKLIDQDAERLADLNSDVESADGAVQAAKAGAQLQSLTAAQLIHLRNLSLNAQQMEVHKNIKESEERSMMEADWDERTELVPETEEAESFR